jgi:hypothetical protein
MQFMRRFDTAYVPIRKSKSRHSYLHADSSPSKRSKCVLAKRKLQIVGYFTTLLLYNHSLKLNSEDYKFETLYLLV